jgi:hypothetical protein
MALCSGERGQELGALEGDGGTFGIVFVIDVATR